MKMRFKILLIVIYLISLGPSNKAFGENEFDYTCPNNLSNPYNKTIEAINNLFKNDLFENERISAGINNLNPGNLQVLVSNTDGYSCYRLNDFKQSWLEQDDKYQVTYFKINSNFFLVRWYNGRLASGHYPIYVFNSQYQLKGVFVI